VHPPFGIFPPQMKSIHQRRFQFDVFNRAILHFELDFRVGGIAMERLDASRMSQVDTDRSMSE
jgi:hypothetical protein